MAFVKAKINNFFNKIFAKMLDTICCVFCISTAQIVIYRGGDKSQFRGA
jgi:hypothetical protein